MSEGKDQHRIAFFFGAGADSCYNIATGKEFISTLLESKYSDEIEKLYGEKMKEFKLVYGNSRNVFLQTIYENKDKAIDVFGKEVVEKCVDYYDNPNRTVKSDEIGKLCLGWYNKIKDKSDEKTEFFLENAVFFDSLDGKFNALRNSIDDRNSKAKRVIFAYTSIFVFMLKELYDTKSIKWTLEEVFNLLNEDYNKINFKKEDTYYNVIKESGMECHILTTNYTDIVEKVTGQKAIYLHGKLTWFEDYEKLLIYDIAKKTERKKAIRRKKKIMPFLLIPSGVKPLICKRQVEEFHKFVETLDKVDTLVIVGYRFNSEDNHINSIIGEWTRNNGNKLIYLNFDDSVDWKKLLWCNDVTRKSFGYDESFLEETIGEKIISINIDKSNAIEVFEKIVNKYK